MVVGTPQNLGDLRAALISRCQLDAGDPRAQAAVLNPIIAEACIRFDMANPHTWPWDALESGFLPLNPGSGNPYIWTPSTFPSKVRYITISDAAATWQFPMQRMTREQQLGEYPDDSQTGTPRTYALGGYDLFGAAEPTVAAFFRPMPDVAYRINIVGYMPVPTFTADSDPDPALRDFQIDDWSDAALEYAAHIVYRGREDVSEAAAASNAFDAAVVSMRRTARRIFGAGVTMRPVVDDFG